VTWATSVPILVFLCLSVLELDQMYATDRRQTKASLNAPPIRGGGIITEESAYCFRDKFRSMSFFPSDFYSRLLSTTSDRIMTAYALRVVRTVHFRFKRSAKSDDRSTSYTNYRTRSRLLGR